VKPRFGSIDSSYVFELRKMPVRVIKVKSYSLSVSFAGDVMSRRPVISLTVDFPNGVSAAELSRKSLIIAARQIETGGVRQ